ncbi:MAG TPA: hypothetical protein VF476_12380 [Chitinophagaceae bacterium]
MKILLGIVSLMGVCNLCIAQFNPLQPPVMPQSPSTAALGKFGEYPVSYFTGLPNISIPLYTIKTKGFEIPITLLYHASGIKVQSYPSWVGSGWALNAGGQITRQLVSVPDELTVIGSLNNEPRKDLDIDLNDQDDRDHLDMVLSGQRDSGGDLFSYSFPGYDGKFFFDRDSSYKAQFMPYAPLKIKKNHTSSILSFDFTDERGNQYEFGKVATEMSVSTDGGFNVSAFMLDKMIAAMYRDTVSFLYQSQLEQSVIERTDKWVVDDQVQHGTAQLDDNDAPMPFPYSAAEGTWSSTLFHPQTICQNQKEIRFKNGKVVFELDTEVRQDFDLDDTYSLTNKRLKTIKVINTSGTGDTLVKVITFYHSYSGSGASKRLTLDSLKVFDKSSGEVAVYKFEYNTGTTLPAPGIDFLSKDYWGYYNGRSNSCLIPQTEIQYQPSVGGSISNITIGSTNSVGREPDSVYMQAGILNRIYYPTGGYTDFEYQTNRYHDGSNVKLAGGLRIKSIKSYDGVSATPITRTYKYGAGESGYGRKNFFDEQSFYFEEQFIENWDRNVNDLGGVPHLIDQKRVRTYLDNPTTGVESMEGAPIVYPVVTEYMDDGTGAIGKTVFTYQDSADLVSHSDMYSTRAIVHSRFFSRGQLLSKKIYRKSGSDYYPVTEETFTYNTSAFPFMNRYYGLNLKQRIVRTPMDKYSGSYTGYDYIFNNITRQSDDSYPTSNSVITYSQDDTTKTITTVSWTSYLNYKHQQPGRITTIDSKGDTIITELRYPADYISSGSTTGEPLLDTMLSRHMQAYAIEQWVRRPQDAVVIEGGVNLYQQLGGGLIVPDKSKRLDIASPINDYTAGSVPSSTLQLDSRYKTKLNFPLYDSKGNVLEVQKEDDIKEVFLWGYNGEHIVAKITNSDYSTASSYITQATLDNPSNDAALRSHLNALRTNMPTKPVVTFTYLPMTGVTSETNMQNRTVYYEYDNAGRLRRIKDKDGNILKVIDYKIQQTQNQ